MRHEGLTVLGAPLGQVAAAMALGVVLSFVIGLPLAGAIIAAIR